MPETVLLTGATGFVGGWCAVELLRRGFHVRAAVRNLESSTRAGEAIRAAAGDTSSRLAFVEADLLSDLGWEAAAEGCAYVMHVASPLGGGAAANDRDALVPAARDGTLRVLRAASGAGVGRVVLTSAAATARTPLRERRTSDETVWADPDDPQFDAYRRSKIFAERAAWDFARENQLELCTILPGAVYGPILHPGQRGGVRVIASLLAGRPAWIPPIGFWITDVRDLAKLHVDALMDPAAAGERFLAAGEFRWMHEMARDLRRGLGDCAPRIPRRRLPLPAAIAMSRFDARLKAFRPFLGQRNPMTTEKARTRLGFAPRPARETLVECAESLLASQGKKPGG